MAELWLTIPDGYAELPLHDLEAVMSGTNTLIADVGTSEQRLAADFALGSLATLLTMLSERNAMYCGIGRHLSVIDGSTVTSTLVVTLFEFPGEREPKLILRDLLEAEAQEGDPAEISLVEMDKRPVLFVERTNQLPAPTIPGQQPPTAAEAPVWQLTASVPSRRGDRLATIEVSTPFVEHGPQYRPMLVDVARSITFEPPQDSDPLAVLLG